MPEKSIISKSVHAIRKEWIFLLGFLILGGTWYIQNIVLSTPQEKVRKFELELQKFETAFLHLKFDGANYRYVMQTLENPTYDDSLDAIRNLFNSVSNTMFTLLQLPGDEKIKPQIQKEYYRFRDSATLYTKNKDLKSYIEMTRALNGQLNGWMIPYQNRGNELYENNLEKVEKGNFLFILFYIFGSILLSISKGWSYLNPPTPETKQTENLKKKRHK